RAAAGWARPTAAALHRSRRRAAAGARRTTARKRARGKGPVRAREWEAFASGPLMQVPGEAEAEAVDARHVVGVGGSVRHLVPGVEEFGAEGAEARDARLVRDAAGEREAGRAGGARVAGIVREPAESDAEVEVETVAGAVADQDRLAAHGPGPGADGCTVVRAAFVGAEIHEHLEAVGEAVAEPEV